MNHTLIGPHKEYIGAQAYTHRTSIRERPRTGRVRQITKNAIPLGCDTMKNTSLFASFWAMPKGRPPVGTTRSVPRARRNWGYRGKAPNRQLSLVIISYHRLASIHS